MQISDEKASNKGKNVNKIIIRSSLKNNKKMMMSKLFKRYESEFDKHKDEINMNILISF